MNFFAGFCMLSRPWEPVRKDMFDLLSKTCEPQTTDTLRFLEIGAETGPNFKYYPKNVKITTIEQNQIFSEQQLAEAKSQNLVIDQSIVGSVENMEMIPDNSFDIVVATMLLCCVKVKSSALAEIQRVLQPNGKFFLIERDQYKTQGFKKIFQGLYSFSHKLTTLGCTACSQDVRSTLSQADFDTSTLMTDEREPLPIPYRFVTYRYVVNNKNQV